MSSLYLQGRIKNGIILVGPKQNIGTKMLDKPMHQKQFISSYIFRLQSRPKFLQIIYVQYSLVS